jgi:hypothetical protein
MGNALLTTHELRRRWKPRKEALLLACDDNPTCVRLHRAFSWLARCEKDSYADVDLSLICLWIGFNALYSQWDERRREPQSDRECWRVFLDKIVALDSSNNISTMLNNQRELVMQIFDDEYLSAFFWEEPTDIRASKSKKVKFDARTWYVEGKWRIILDRLLERIYLLRCQLIHGAATHGGKLNRTSIERCVTMMRALMDAMLMTFIDQGYSSDWGIMCYPPHLRKVPVKSRIGAKLC